MDGNQLTLGAAGGSFNYTLSDVASNVNIQIMDDSGNVVRTVANASGTLGKHSISWDGKDDAGNQLPYSVYSVKVTAATSSGTAVTTKVTANGIVDGIEKDANGNILLNSGQLQFTTDKILAIRDTYIPNNTVNNNASGDATSTGA